MQKYIWDYQMIWKTYSSTRMKLKVQSQERATDQKKRLGHPALPLTSRFCKPTRTNWIYLNKIAPAVEEDNLYNLFKNRKRMPAG